VGWGGVGGVVLCVVPLNSVFICDALCCVAWFFTRYKQYEARLARSGPRLS